MLLRVHVLALFKGARPPPTHIFSGGCYGLNFRNSNSYAKETNIWRKAIVTVVAQASINAEAASPAKKQLRVVTTFTAEKLSRALPG